MQAEGADQSAITSVWPHPFDPEGQSEAARAQHAHRLSQHPGLPSVARLAALAAQLTASGAAQVSLISQVQTVVGGAGLAETSTGVESDTADSLCTVTVQSNAPLRVDDASSDVRVAHLPPVPTGTVGSYLGVPLHAGADIVGALCVYNAEPRLWTDQDVNVLEGLASPIVAALELATIESEYNADRMLWQLAIDAGGVGAFDWNLGTGELRWDDRLLHIFGFDRRSFAGTIEAFLDAVHPEDQARVTAALQASITGLEDFEIEYRIVSHPPDVRWVTARGRPLPGPDGAAVKVVGAASDTTGARETAARVARVMDTLPTAFFHLDSEWRFTFANVEAKRLLGDVSADIVGAVLWELFPDAVGTEFETHYRAAVETNEPVTFEAYYPAPLDSWYEVRAWPGPDGLSVYFLRVNDQHEARAVLARSAQRSALLAEVTQAMLGTLDAHEAASRLTQLLVPRLGDWSIVTLVQDASATLGVRPSDWRHGLLDAAASHKDEAMQTVVQEFIQERVEALSDESFTARAVRLARPVVINGQLADRLDSMLLPGQARDLAAVLDPWSAVVLPLAGHDRTVGLLTVVRGRDQGPFTVAEVAALEEVAGRAGLTLDNLRLYREQRDLASQLQQSMLTPPPEPDHLHVAVRYAPAAQAAQVGGDWYDAFLQRDGATVVVIGDVVGHDTAAAAAMGQLRSIMRGIAVSSDAAPAELLSRVDDATELLMLNTTATAVVARFEQTPEQRRAGLTQLRWSNAGHPPPIVVAHPDDTLAPQPSQGRGQAASQAADAVAVVERSAVLWGSKPNLLLGIDSDVSRDESVITLRRGATVLLYTDGLVERRGQDLDRGIERLRQELTDLVAQRLPLEELCDVLLSRLLPHRPDDDVALVAVRLHHEDQPRPPEAGPQRIPSSVSEPPPL